MNYAWPKKPKLGNLVLNLNVNCHEDGMYVYMGMVSSHLFWTLSALDVTMYFFPNHYRLKTSIVINEQVII